MRDDAVIANADTVSWLLEGDDPSVRFFTLTGLLGKGQASRWITLRALQVLQACRPAEGTRGVWSGV